MSRIPKVSVCIPTINRPHFLREAIASVAAQTFADFEIVVGDNSGDDNLHRQIDAVLGEFPNLQFTLVRHPRQVDAPENFNSLIDKSQGEFWTCLPDDDRVRATFLERSVRVLEANPECAFTFSDHWVMGADGGVDEAQSVAASAMFGRSLLREGVYLHHELFEIVMRQSLCMQATVFRLPAIATLRFVPGILTLDQSLFLRMSSGRTPYIGYYLDERLMEYRLHAAQVSATTPRSEFIRAVIAGYETVGMVPPRHVQAFNAKLGRAYLALAMAEAEQGDRRNARAHALRSFKLSPDLHNTLGALLTVAVPGAIPGLRYFVEWSRRSIRSYASARSGRTEANL